MAKNLIRHIFIPTAKGFSTLLRSSRRITNERASRRNVYGIREDGERRWQLRYRFIREGAIFPIKLYRRFASPYFGRGCRFTPTCSEYAEKCIRQHGIIKGLYLTTRRLLKCHPWHEGGSDPVPDA